MNYSIQIRYEQYLEIFDKALDRLVETEKKNEIVENWLQIYSHALYNDKELINNVLADIVKYEVISAGFNIPISKGVDAFRQQLKDYTVEDITNVVCNIENAKYNSLDIIKESFSKITFILDDL